MVGFRVRGGWARHLGVDDSGDHKPGRGRHDVAQVVVGLVGAGVRVKS